MLHALARCPPCRSQRRVARRVDWRPVAL